jgi:hypothetical protein
MFGLSAAAAIAAWKKNVLAKTRNFAQYAIGLLLIIKYWHSTLAQSASEGRHGVVPRLRFGLACETYSRILPAA